MTGVNIIGILLTLAAGPLTYAFLYGCDRLGARIEQRLPEFALRRGPSNVNLTVVSRFRSSHEASVEYRRDRAESSAATDPSTAAIT
jgi:hypothetical protein